MNTVPSETSIRSFLAAVASGNEGHGAVSAAAVAGGVGVSLLARVAALPMTRSDSVEDHLELIKAAGELSDAQEQLIETIETETAVKLFTARQMPQVSKAQRAERQAAIQLALRAGADVPLEVMRLCADGLRLAQTIAAHGAHAASADVQLGVALLYAAFSGARANLEGKLSSLTDVPHITAVVAEIARLSEETAAAMRATEPFLQQPPA